MKQKAFEVTDIGFLKFKVGRMKISKQFEVIMLKFQGIPI